MAIDFENARANKLSKEAVKKLEEGASMDCTVDEMCLLADISTPTYYEWLKKYPELSVRLAKLRNKPILKARSVVLANLSQVETSKWYLERKKKDEFAQRNELTSAGGEELIKNSKLDLLAENLEDKLKEQEYANTRPEKLSADEVNTSLAE